jgi:beta-1,4-N-acetylglucosaminyltransferase
MEAFSGNDIFFITYESNRTRNLEQRNYLIENIGTSVSKMIFASFTIAGILLKEKPNIMVSTGSEIAIPAFYLAKLFRIRTIFIESWCRVKVPSGTGKLVYAVSDVFLVQWQQMLNAYGPKAEFMGAVI